MQSKAFRIKRIEELCADLVEAMPVVQPDLAIRVESQFNSASAYRAYAKYLSEEIKKSNQYFMEWLKMYCGQSWVPKDAFSLGLFSYALLRESGKLPVITWRIKNMTIDERQRINDPDWVSGIIHRLGDDTDPASNCCFLDSVDRYIDSTQNHGRSWSHAIFIYRMFEKQAEINRKQIN
jgi:hypothetical protein